MFKDRQEALEELEAELLREEQEEAQLPEEGPEEPEYRNFSNDYGRLHAYNRDVEDADLDDFVQQVHTAGNRSRVMGRVALALALLADIWSAKMTREHNDTNMMAMGAAIVGEMLGLQIVDTWLGTEFSHNERHQRRIDKVMALED